MANYCYRDKNNTVKMFRNKNELINWLIYEKLQDEDATWVQGYIKGMEHTVCDNEWVRAKQSEKA